MRLWIGGIAVLVLFGGGVGRAQHCSSSFSQSLAVVHDGKIQLVCQVRKPVFFSETRTVTQYEDVTESITVTVNGKPETRTVCKKVPVQKEVAYTVQKSVCELQTREIAESAATAYDIAGKPLNWAELTKRLAQPTLVVVSANGKPLPPQMAAVFKPETIVLVPPPQVPQAFDAPAAGPLPSEGPVPRPRYAPIDGGGGRIEATAPAILPIAPPQSRPRPAPVDGSALPQKLDRRFHLVTFQTPVEEQTLGGATSNSGSLTMTSAPPPNLQFASLSENGGVRMTTVNTVESTAYVAGPERDGKGKPTDAMQKVPVVQYLETRLSIIYPMQLVEAETIDGRQVSAEILARYLKTERVVLVASEGPEVDKYWLRNMKPTTLILRMPPAEPGYAASVAQSMPLPITVARPPTADVPATAPPLPK